MRILLTGASGFVGRHCLRILAGRGDEVHALTRATPAAASKDVVWHEVDLLTPGAPRAIVRRVRPTHILHLAWSTEHGRFWTDPANLDWVAASLELARAVCDCGGERMVWAGTCAEYDWSSEPPFVERATKLGSSTLYGRSKQALADLLSAYLTQEGMGHAWGRIFFAFGPGEQPSRFVPFVTRALLEHRIAPIAHDAAVRDFLYVEDVAAAFIALLTSPVSGPVNIASGHGTALRDVALMLARQLGRERLVQPRGEGDMEIEKTAEPASIVADTHRLRDEVGWKASVGLENGLRKTLEYWSHEIQHRH